MKKLLLLCSLEAGVGEKRCGTNKIVAVLSSRDVSRL